MEKDWAQRVAESLALKGHLSRLDIEKCASLLCPLEKKKEVMARLLIEFGLSLPEAASTVGLSHEDLTTQQAGEAGDQPSTEETLDPLRTLLRPETPATQVPQATAKPSLYDRTPPTVKRAFSRPGAAASPALRGKEDKIRPGSNLGV